MNNAQAIVKAEENRNRQFSPGRGERVFDIVNIIFFIFFSFIMLYPFWYVIVLSFNEGRNAALGPIWFWPRKFTLDNYVFVIRNPILINGFVMTIIRTFLFPVFSVAITMMAAYALSKKDIPGKKLMLYILMIPLFIGGTIITNYVVIAKLGLLNNFLVYVLPASYSFFYMVIMRTFIEQIPVEIEESTKIDGANYFTIFARIIAPLSKPIIATFLFFGATYAWLDFSTSLFYITKKSLFVVQYILYQVLIGAQANEFVESSSGLVGRTGMANEQPTFQVLKMSTLVIVTFPIFFAYPFFQKYFIKGLTVGAVKG